MKLSPHQQRVLAALLALEEQHGLRWWDREAIGHVVGAGGYHQVIQRATMRVLKQAGLIITEWTAMPEEVRPYVRCGCSSYEWGLTDAGRAVATSLNIRWTGEAAERLANVPVYDCRHLDDDEWPWFRDDEDDDDGGDDPQPLTPIAGGSCA